MCLKTPLLNTDGTESVDEVRMEVDCRVFRNFINPTSIKSAAIFINASGGTGGKAQINNLNILERVCEDHVFEPVQYNRVSAQFEMDLLALKEEQKFLNYIE